MARPIKSTVEYFPHFVKGGRTVFILESKFGNDGYAFWFKLLEILCDSDRQLYDCSQPSNMSYLLAKSRCDEETALAIITELVNIGKIDKYLWEQERKIWVQNLVNNLDPIYKKRKDVTPTIESFRAENDSTNMFPLRKHEDENVSAAETQDTKLHLVKESKEKKSKEDNMAKSPIPYDEIVSLWNSTCTAFPKVMKLTDARKVKIKARLAEFGTSKDVWLATAEALFEQVQASDFLRGDNNSTWQATFDWLFENGTNWVKVLEGNYDNKGSNRSAPATGRTQTKGITLGIGEYIDATGRRTYGTGAATIPVSAPPRPSERYYWNASTSQWTLQ